MRSAPGLSTVMSGAWRASTPSSPSTPVAMMNSTSPSNRLRSTLTTRSGYFNSSCLLHLLALLPCLFDGAHHVESLLGVLGQLLHAEDRDDVLEVLVALHHLLDALRRVVVRLPDDRRLDETAGRAERVDGGIDADLDERSLEPNGGAEVGENGLDGGVRVVVRRHVHRLH